MKKIESARIIVANKGRCFGLKGNVPAIECRRCFNSKNSERCKDITDKEVFVLAQSYIKRHEGKSKKRIIPRYTADIQPDKTNAECKKVVTLPTVTRPNFRKALREKKEFWAKGDKDTLINLIDILHEEGIVTQRELRSSEKDFRGLSVFKGSSVFGYTAEPHRNLNLKTEYDPATDTLIEEKVKEPTVKDPTPLDIAKAIRDNGYNCNVLPNHYSCFDMRCPMAGNGGCGYSHNIEDVDKTLKDLRKQLIDDYIARHDHIVDKHEMIEPKPISLPDVVYSASKFGVSFVNTKDKTFTTNEKGELFINNEPCFTIPEEALAVALKRWQK